MGGYIALRKKTTDSEIISMETLFAYVFSLKPNFETPSTMHAFPIVFFFYDMFSALILSFCCPHAIENQRYETFI